MNLEGVSEQVFSEEIAKSPVGAKTDLLVAGRSGVSLAKTMLDYGVFYRNCDSKIRPFLATGLPMLVTLWSYGKISGRSINQLNSEGVLVPGVILYKTLVTQDDILDASILRGEEIKAKEAFWYKDPLPQDINPREGFRLMVDSICRNEQLSRETRSGMLRKIAETYRSYTTAEDDVKEMARVGEEDLYGTYLLRVRCYAAMAEAITRVWNGGNCSPEIEKRMAWFSMMSDILDGELDMDEDLGNTVTVPIAAQRYDEENGQVIGTTKERILNWYFSQIDNLEIKNLILVGRDLRPKIDAVFSRLQSLRGKGPVCSFVIRRQTPTF